MSGFQQLLEQFGKHCLKGQVLFKEGDPGRTMYIIHSGKVRITKGPEKRVLATLGAGEFFGEMAILLQQPRGATAEIAEDAELLELDKKKFELMIVNNIEIAVRLIKKLARRLDSANSIIDMLMHADSKARVIVALSHVADRQGKALADGSVEVAVGVRDLADSTGTQLEQAESVIARLERLNIVKVTQSSIVVIDQMRLGEFLEFIEQQSHMEKK